MALKRPGGSGQSIGQTRSSDARLRGSKEVGQKRTPIAYIDLLGTVLRVMTSGCGAYRAAG